MDAKTVKNVVKVITSIGFFPEDQLDKEQTKSDIIRNMIRIFETENRDITLFSMQISVLQYLPAYSQETRLLQNLSLLLK